MKVRDAFKQGLLKQGVAIDYQHYLVADLKFTGIVLEMDTNKYIGVTRHDGVIGTGNAGAWLIDITDQYSEISVIEEKYPPLKYHITIGEKPIGNWRPKAIISFMKVANVLNIEPVIHLEDVIPRKLFKQSSRWSSETISFYMLVDIEEGYADQFFLEWRNGINPSYQDYAKAFKKACDMIVAEYNRRCEEALGSSGSVHITITPDVPEIQERKEGIRKLRTLIKPE